MIAITVSADDVQMMHAIERFFLGYDGDDLFHAIDLNFPGASFRAFLHAIERARTAQWTEGCA
jgi:hypothetical protein